MPNKKEPHGQDVIVNEFDTWISENYIRLLDLQNMEGVKEIFLKWKDLRNIEIEKLLKKFDDLMEDCNKVRDKYNKPSSNSG